MMKKIIVYLVLVLVPISSWAKIITKEEVKTRFIEMVKRDMPEKIIDINCLDEDCLRSENIYPEYILPPSSVEISLPDNPGMWFGELEPGVEYYEVHADFYKVSIAEDQQGKMHKIVWDSDKFHFNGTLKIYSEGVNGKKTYSYSMRVLESKFYSYYASCQLCMPMSSESDDPLTFSNWYRWTVAKSYY